MNPDAVAPCWTYSIAKGIFAGISLEGATINERSGVNAMHYMKDASSKQLLAGEIPPTPAAAKLHEKLKELEGTQGLPRFFFLISIFSSQCFSLSI